MFEKICSVFTPFKTRQRKLLAARFEYNKQDFVSFFAKKNVDQNIPMYVWDRLQKEASISGFKVVPEDDISYLFGIVDEDFEDLIEEVINGCNRKVPNDDILKEMEPIGSVSDLVLFVSKCGVCTKK